MRILLVHNFYGSGAPSGENNVFHIEKKMLENFGHTVRTFTRFSDEIRDRGFPGLLAGALSTPWNPFTFNEMKKQIELFRPEILHAHNTFPLVSPSVFYSAHKLVPTVLTLHNYRTVCAAGIPMRNGRICDECITIEKAWPAVRHGCYRNSRIATLPLAFGIQLHKALGTWRKQIDAFIALSDFQKRVLARSGFPEEKIHVKPNFYPGQSHPLKWEERDECIVYAGRLSQEKGIHTLLDAWNSWGEDAPTLKIVGDGPLADSVKRASDNQSNILFLGQVSPENAEQSIASAYLLILPSQNFEGFPMVIREAFALGTPVASSNIGPLPDIVTHNLNGVIFEPFSADSIRERISELWNNREQLVSLSNGAYNTYLEKYTEDKNYEILSDIYEKARHQFESDRNAES